MHSPHLVAVVERFVSALDDRGIAWCVLRNHEDFPNPRSDTSDLDLLIGCSMDLATILLSAAAPAGEVGVGRVFVKSDGLLRGFYLTAPGYPSLHIDLFTGLAWLGFPIVDVSKILAGRRRIGLVSTPSPGHEAAVSLLSYLVHQGSVKLGYRTRVQQLLSTGVEEFVECLTPIWGDATSRELADRTIAGDWKWFEDWIAPAKQRLLFSALRAPIRTMASASQLVRNMAMRVLSPPGAWVAFLGPDGAGKTLLAEMYRQRLATLYYPQRQRHFHWRPRWLPSPGTLAGHPETAAAATDPHAKSPHGRLVSEMRLLYFWVDYVLGHWVLVRGTLAQGGLVTFDRYFDDFLVDQRRYRLAVPRWVLTSLAQLVPRPEIVFVLDAPAEVLCARKRELTVEETDKQLKALRELSTRNPRSRIVRVDRSPDEIVADLERQTLEYLDKRTRRRIGWPVDAPLRTSANS